MTDDRKNFEAIYDFVEFWRVGGKLKVNPLGNCTVTAQIIYNSDLGTQAFQTKVTLIRKGYDDGKIALDEIGVLVSEDYHLDFSARFQKVSFNNKTKTLTVKGTSGKMGDYQVDMTPV